jgi:Fanconi anemia group M protein
VDIEKIFVELPDNFSEVKHYLDLCIKSKTRELKEYGFVTGSFSYGKKSLLQLQGAIHARIAKGEKDFEVLKSMSLLAEIIKIHHSIELLETQGVDQLKQYVEKLEKEAISGKTKASQNLVRDVNFRSAIVKLNNISEDFEHPKINKLMEIVKKELDESQKKIMIFTHYRDSGSKITKMLNEAGYKSKLFVGQAKKKDTGLTQKAQKEMIEEFSSGKFDVLVSSSVGEEGLDIPQVDIVLFYEPVPSAIRKIQRSGRTGRLEKGKIIMLITKNTIDEVYFHVARNKERRMYSAIKDIKKDFTLNDMTNDNNKNIKKSSEKKITLNDYEDKYSANDSKQKEKRKNSDIKIYADYREKGSNVLKCLIDNDVELRLEKLAIGDFLLSSKVVVEYKNVQDFVDSIIDGRLLSQLRDLKKYERPLIIVEGEEDIYSARRVHPNAIRGMLATITVSYGIPLIQTKTSQETAELLMIIAKRVQSDEKADVTHHFSKPTSLKEQQEYFISALPNIGMGGARPLLKRFGTVKGIVNASEKELQEAEQIGPKKAKTLKELFDTEWFE